MNRMQRDEPCASQAAGDCGGPGFQCEESFWKAFDDVYRDYMLTPPQSPPVSDLFAQPDEPMVLDESLSAALDGLLEESGLTDLALDSFESADMAILSDCMWSSGPEEPKAAGRSQVCGAEAALLLSGAFENILVSEEPLVPSDALEAGVFCDVPAHDSSSDSETDDVPAPCPRLVVPGSDSLIDHSYGSTCPQPTRPLSKPLKRLSSTSSASSSSSCTSLLSAEYRTGKSKRLAEKRRAKQKLLEADPVTVKFIKRTSSSPVSASGRKQAVIRCKSAQRKPVAAACADRAEERLSCESQQSVLLSPTRVPVCEPVVVLCPQSPAPAACPVSILREPAAGPKKQKKEKHFPERRREHNDSEKKRRDQLRNAFLSLRDQIPKFRDQGRRPPRIHILFEAASYVTLLAEKSAYLEKIKCSETVKRDKLLRRLRLLQQQQPSL